MCQIFLNTVDAGGKKEVLLFGPEHLESTDFARNKHDHLVASGDFGFVKYEQFRFSENTFRSFSINTNKQIEIHFLPGSENISFFYTLSGYFQHRSDESALELIAQKQVKPVHEESGKSYFLNTRPTSGKAFTFLHITIPLSKHIERSQDNTEIKDYFRKCAIVGKAPKVFLATLEFQKSITNLRLEIKNHKPSIPVIHALINILLLELVLQTENQREIEIDNDSWDKEKSAVYHMAESIILGMDESLTIKNFAQAQHINPNRLKILFKEYMGMPAAAFRISVRMQKAKQLLTETNISIQEISTLVGYSNPAQFSTMFKKKMGCSPHDIRR